MKSTIFIYDACEFCDGTGCEKCDDTGVITRAFERDVPVGKPCALAKALEKERVANELPFESIADILSVSEERAGDICRGRGAKMNDEEVLYAIQFLIGITNENIYIITVLLAEIGDGDILGGLELVKNIADRLRHARRKHAWPDEADGKFQALGVIHAEYRELEQAVEHGEGREREKDEALDVIATAARFWMGEHERND